MYLILIGLFGILFYFCSDPCIGEKIQQTINDFRDALNAGSPNCIKFQDIKDIKEVEKKNGNYHYYVYFTFSGR